MNRLLPIINVFSYACLVIVNFLAVQIPFFGKSPGDVSDLYPNLLTPADFTFRIWSLIYISLAVFIYHQSKTLFSNDKQLPKEVSAIGIYFFISCLLNIGWLVTWQSLNIAWSFIMIFVLWIILILIYNRLDDLKEAKLVYAIPFSVYLAWVCISTMANLNVMLIDAGFDFFGMAEDNWTALLIFIGILGTVFVLYLRKDIWFTIVLIWAFFGMFAKNKLIAPEWNIVVYTSLFAMISLAVIASLLGVKKLRIKN